jgi:hypothetical protein
VIDEKRGDREWADPQRLAVFELAGEAYLCSRGREEGRFAQQPRRRCAGVDRNVGADAINKPVVIRMGVRDDDADEGRVAAGDSADERERRLLSGSSGERKADVENEALPCGLELDAAAADLL